jgi:hypothetical protein
MLLLCGTHRVSTVCPQGTASLDVCDNNSRLLARVWWPLHECDLFNGRGRAPSYDTHMTQQCGRRLEYTKIALDSVWKRLVYARPVERPVGQSLSLHENVEGVQQA